MRNGGLLSVETYEGSVHRVHIMRSVARECFHVLKFSQNLHGNAHAFGFLIVSAVSAVICQLLMDINQ